MTDHDQARTWWDAGVDQWTLAVTLAALGEYALNHPGQVAAVDQAESALLSQWGGAGLSLDLRDL